MNPVYALVKNCNDQLVDVYSELNLLSSQYSDNEDIQTAISNRVTKLYIRSNTLLMDINTYMSAFASQSPAINIPEIDQEVIYGMNPKYLDALKTYTEVELAPLWNMLLNCSDNNMKQACIFSFCDL